MGTKIRVDGTWIRSGISCEMLPCGKKSNYAGRDANVAIIRDTSERLDSLSIEELNAFYSWWADQDGDALDKTICRSSQMRALLPADDYRIISNRLDQYEKENKGE